MPIRDASPESVSLVRLLPSRPAAGRDLWHFLDWWGGPIQLFNASRTDSCTDNRHDYDGSRRWVYETGCGPEQISAERNVTKKLDFVPDLGTVHQLLHYPLAAARHPVELVYAGLCISPCRVALFAGAP